LLQGKLAEAISGNGNIVLFEGNAGAGKSRLLNEFSKIVVRSNCEFISANCLEDISIPYLPIKNLVEVIGSKKATRSTQESKEKFIKIFSSRPENNIEFYESIMASFSDLFKKESVKQPLVLFIDDIHWSDTSSLSILTNLANEISRSRILLVLTYRPEELNNPKIANRSELIETINVLSKKANAISITLNLLTPEETRELVSSSLGGPVDLVLTNSIFEASTGNPLVILESIRYLMFNNNLTVKKGSWTQSGSIPVSLPHRITLMIDQRFDRLAKEEKEILWYLAAYGREMRVIDLMSIVGLDTILLTDCVETLTKEHYFIIEKDEKIAFVHGLVRSSIYDEIEPFRKEIIHGKIANFLEAKTDMDEREEMLSWHYYWAKDFDKCISSSLIAGETCLQTNALREAVTYFSRAAEVCAPEKKDHELGIAYEGLGDAFRDLMEIELARANYFLCIDRAGTEDAIARIYWKLSEICYPTRKEDDEWITRMKYIEMAEACTGVRTEDLAEIKLSKAQYKMWDGELEESDILFLEAEELYNKAGNKKKVAHTLLCHCDLDMTREDVASVLKKLEVVNELLKTENGIMLDVQYNGIATEVFLMQGIAEKVLEHGSKMADSAIRLGHHSDTMWANFYMALEEYIEDDIERSYDYAVKALDFANLVGAEYSQTGSKCLLSMICLKKGLVEESQRLAEHALIMTDAMPPNLNTPTIGLAWCVNGMLHNNLRNWEASVMCFAQALMNLQHKRLRIIDALAKEWYGDALQTHGLREEAMAMFDSAKILARNLHNEVMVVRIDAKMNGFS